MNGPVRRTERRVGARERETEQIEKPPSSLPQHGMPAFLDETCDNRVDLSGSA